VRVRACVCLTSVVKTSVVVAVVENFTPSHSHIFIYTYAVLYTAHTHTRARVHMRAHSPEPNDTLNPLYGHCVIYTQSNPCSAGDVCIHTNTRLCVYIYVYKIYIALLLLLLSLPPSDITYTAPADIYRLDPPSSQWTTRDVRGGVYYTYYCCPPDEKKNGSAPGKNTQYYTHSIVRVESRHAPCNYAATWPTCTSDIWWVRFVPRVCLCRWQAIIINNNNKITRCILYIVRTHKRALYLSIIPIYIYIFYKCRENGINTRILDRPATSPTAEITTPIKINTYTRSRSVRRIIGLFVFPAATVHNEFYTLM